MRSTGFVRKLDNLGRLTIPSELRRKLDIDIRDAVEIYVDTEFIVLKKYEPCDMFTGEMSELIDFEGRKVSKNSILKMAQLAGLELNL